MKVILRILVCSVMIASAAYAQGTPLPYAKIQFFDNSGRPLASGSVCTFASGTTSPRATFTDYSLTTTNPQCVPLDSSGRASIWLDPAVIYRVVLRDSVGVLVWSQDGVPGSGGGSGTGGGGGGGGTSLWTQNGGTIYNGVLGSKVCIAATACGTALAELNVAGTTSGSTHLLRIDDTANNPGIDLYGSGGAYMGSYLGGSTGLRLQSADGFAQMTVSAGMVNVQNAATSGGTLLNLKMSATQGSVNPFRVQDSAGTNLAYIDPAGVFYSTGANGGINVTGSATHVDSIQTVGGVTGTWLYARDSLFLACEPVPALSGAGQARVYCDSTTTPKAIYASIDGGAYVPIGAGGSGSSLFSGIGTGTNTSATMTVGTGGTLTFSGSGIVNASKINATTVPTSPAADMLLITTAAGVGAWTGATLNSAGLAHCPDSGGNHLNYNTSTHVFSCGTTGGTVGSVSFSAITASTNTTAAMVIGSGASIDFTGSGTIAANLFNNAVAPPSGTIWRSNGSLQPIAAVSSDVVALFAGGDGCSGTNTLAADGTCRSASGAGIYLPLTGGTMVGALLFQQSPAIDVGSANFPPRHGYFSGNVEGVNLRIISGTPSSIIDFFDWRIGNTHMLDLRNSSANLVMRLDDLQHQFGMNGTLYPMTGGTYDLGVDTNSRWRTLWVNGVNASGALFAQTLITTAGIINSANNIVTTGLVSSGPIVGDVITGGGTGGLPLTLNGAPTTNGNIILAPGNVAGNSFVQINGRANGIVTNLALTLNEIGSAAGSGIVVRHSGVFDAAWQGGASAAFDVVGNDQTTHRFIVYQNGHIQSTGSAPSISGGGTCTLGGGSSDVRGSYVCNVSGIATITFAAPFTSTPVCIATSDNINGPVAVTGVITSGVTFGLAAANNRVWYHCIQ